MPHPITKESLREVTPLRASDPIGRATERVIEEQLPALPVVDDRGKFIGIFGEREFMRALFPAYVDTLANARMVRRSVDDTIERRGNCSEEQVGKYVTGDQILVEDDYSDTELVEIFLHHRVLVVPIATDGVVRAVVTRSDFFKALYDRMQASRAAGAAADTASD